MRRSTPRATHSGDGIGEEGLATTWRAVQQDASWRLDTKMRIQLGMRDGPLDEFPHYTSRTQVSSVSCDCRLWRWRWRWRWRYHLEEQHRRLQCQRNESMTEALVSRTIHHRSHRGHCLLVQLCHVAGVHSTSNALLDALSRCQPQQPWRALIDTAEWATASAFRRLLESLRTWGGGSAGAVTSSFGHRCRFERRRALCGSDDAGTGRVGGLQGCCPEHWIRGGRRGVACGGGGVACGGACCHERWSRYCCCSSS